ncbi:MAG: hypothetical protein ACLVKW_05640 [Fenollaria massiliensis]|uniref:Uncharacterized protein n=1 Tax=Fenollaria massiliensis TaxID=938288 RepID=A0A9E7DK93_9FIRM|nr:hypothetical protein [Fenollaria massiliensis]AVM66863.1 hypothetical protein C3V37_02980 [Peptostreptococcaceae bacterium oral taxon 929]UQK59465.1 hypothetical protein M1R53_02065 [Fenollaria massiliensis]
MAKNIDDKFMDLMKETNEKFDALKNKINNIPKMSKAGTRLITKEEKELIENSKKEENNSIEEKNTEE